MTRYPITGVVLEALDARADSRGAFTELLRLGGYPYEFAQVNHSHSEAGVLRGLHFHRRQADLWYVPHGRIQVGLVDLRTQRSRPSIQTLILSAASPARLLIPPGVAHGFLALERSDLIYLVTHEYDATDEYGLAWDDETAAVPWSTHPGMPLLSERDKENPKLSWEDIPSFL
jgi:dTDP-4-dehydrorhamnose 3,5-epimerase